MVKVGALEPLTGPEIERALAEELLKIKGKIEAKSKESVVVVVILIALLVSGVPKNALISMSACLKLPDPESLLLETVVLKEKRGDERQERSSAILKYLICIFMVHLQNLDSQILFSCSMFSKRGSSNLFQLKDGRPNRSIVEFQRRAPHSRILPRPNRNRSKD